MPDYFSHVILAEKIYERLDGASKAKVKSRTLFTVGAVGPDVFFTYNLKPSKSNLGRDLHRKNAYDIFCALTDGNPSYAAGYATHYALDSTLHPAVYDYESKHKNPLSHQRFESDLGLYISKLYRIRRTILPRERLLECTGPVYDSIKLLEPDVTVTGVERCLKRHFTYTRYLYRTKKQTFKCSYDFAALESAVKEAEEFGLECAKHILSGDIDGAIFNKLFLQK